MTACVSPQGFFGRSKMSLFGDLSVNDCLRVPAGAFLIPQNYPYGLPLGHLGVSLALCGLPLGPLCLLSSKSLEIDVPRVSRVDFFIDVCSGIIGLELIPGIPGFRGIRGSAGSGVINYSSEPPFHTRRGSG